MAMTRSCTTSGVRKRDNTEHIAKLTHVHVEWEQATDGSNTEAVGLGHLTRVDHHAALGEVGVHGCVRGYNGKSEHRGQGTRSTSDILGRSKLGSSGKRYVEMITPWCSFSTYGKNPSLDMPACSACITTQ